MRLTGWVVIVGSCLVALVTAGVATALLEHVAPGSAGPGSVITNLDIPGSALVAGVAILTTARILRLAVELRQDVDATI